MLINELHKSGRFDIVERKNIEDVLKEIKFGESKWVEKTSAAKAGDVLGAQCILFASAGRIAGNVVIYLRLVDVSTSRVTASVLEAGPDLHGAVVSGVAQLVKANERSPWVAKIAKIDADGGKTIVINSGKDLGVEAGDTFAVFTLGEAIKDPDSGKFLGYLEKGAGVVRIVEVQQHLSIAEPVTLTREVRVGDLVRPAIEE